MTLRCVFGFLLVAALSCGPGSCHYGDGWERSHSGSQIWKVSCGDAKDCGTELASLQQKLDLLFHSNEGDHHFLVQPHEISQTRAHIENTGLEYNVHVDDVSDYLMEQHKADVLYAETRAEPLEQCTQDVCPKPLLHQYMSFQQVEWFLQELAKTFPKQVTLTSEGKTLEGRDIWLVKVSKDNADAAGGKQKAVFIEGGAHAREWVSPATTLNILMQQANECISEKNCDYTFYFMPLLNPDGYEYTRNTDRLWRKNRSDPPTNSSCYGVDLNRNWNFHWGEQGASTDPCADDYRGSNPACAEEVITEDKTIKAIMNDNNKDLILYLSYHSFSQLVLLPWGYSANVTTPDFRELQTAGQLYSDTLYSVHQAKFQVIQASSLYPASGTSQDYVKNLGVKYAITLELRDTGEHAFVLPASQIILSFEENWAAFKALTKYVDKSIL